LKAATPGHLSPSVTNAGKELREALLLVTDSREDRFDLFPDRTTFLRTKVFLRRTSSSDEAS
jgi:hypothetical protein